MLRATCRARAACCVLCAAARASLAGDSREMALRGAVYVNGTIRPADQAVVPVYDHGFLYGEGVYETLRTYNHVPFLYDRHMRRLRASSDRLHLEVPFSDQQLSAWIDETVAAAGEMKESYIRILLTRGVGD